MVDQLLDRCTCRPGAVAEEPRVLGDNHGQSMARISLLEAGCYIPGVEIAMPQMECSLWRDLGHLSGVEILPTQLDGGDASDSVRQKVTVIAICWPIHPAASSLNGQRVSTRKSIPPDASQKQYSRLSSGPVRGM